MVYFCTCNNCKHKIKIDNLDCVICPECGEVNKPNKITSSDRPLYNWEEVNLYKSYCNLTENSTNLIPMQYENIVFIAINHGTPHTNKGGST